MGIKFEGSIVETIEYKRLIWYGHLEMMGDSRWPKKIYNWVPTEKRKKGRPKRRWKNDVETAMVLERLQERD
jgi:hypothetical protein